MEIKTIAALTVSPILAAALAWLLRSRIKTGQTKRHALKLLKAREALRNNFLNWLHHLYDERSRYSDDSAYLLCVRYGSSLRGISNLAEFKIYVQSRHDRQELLTLFLLSPDGIGQSVDMQEWEYLLGD